jgi:hypothetical protein
MDSTVMTDPFGLPAAFEAASSWRVTPSILEFLKREV